jgi:hypothetical protein
MIISGAKLASACAGIVLLIGQEALAQCQHEEVFTSFREGIQQVVDLPPFANPIPQDEINALLTNISALEALLSKGKEVPEAYCQVLTEEAVFLNEAAAAQRPDDLAKAVRAVADDVNVKLTFAKSSMALASASMMVEITVKTLKNGQEEKGLAVAMTPLLFEGKTPMFNFPALSSPTTTSVPPGRYLLTASKSGEIVCKREVEAGLCKSPEPPVECGYE